MNLRSSTRQSSYSVITSLILFGGINTQVFGVTAPPAPRPAVFVAPAYCAPEIHALIDAANRGDLRALTRLFQGDPALIYVGFPAILSSTGLNPHEEPFITIFHILAYHGHTHILDDLVRNGVSIASIAYALSTEKLTPLHYAIMGNQLVILGWGYTHGIPTEHLLVIDRTQRRKSCSELRTWLATNIRQLNNPAITDNQRTYLGTGLRLLSGIESITECDLCFENLAPRNICFLACGHHSCLACFNRYLKGACATCSTPLTGDNWIEVPASRA